MKDDRLSFSELEALCDRQRCRFNDLFLVGGSVFVMEDPDDWALPNKYRPLLLDDPSKMEKLPEILRRLSAVEFPSMQAFCEAIAYKLEYDRVFPVLRDELYEILIRHSRAGATPDGGQYCLNLDGCGENEGLILSCQTRDDLTPLLVKDIQHAINKFESTFNWNVRVHEGTEPIPFCLIYHSDVRPWANINFESDALKTTRGSS